MELEDVNFRGLAFFWVGTVSVHGDVNLAFQWLGNTGVPAVFNLRLET